MKTNRYLLLIACLLLFNVGFASGAVTFWDEYFERGYHFTGDLTDETAGADTLNVTAGSVSYVTDMRSVASQALLLETTGTETVNSAYFTPTSVNSTGAESFSVWVKMSDAVSGWIRHGGGAISWSQLNWYCDGSGCNVKEQGGNNGGTQSFGTLLDGNWHHFVIILTLNNVTIYNDGTKVGSTSLLPDDRELSINQPLMLQGNGATDNTFDELIHLNSALTHAQVQELWTGSQYYDRWDNVTAPVVGANISTIQTSSQENVVSSTIGNSYGVINSFNYENTNATTTYVTAQIETNASSASTAICRINFDGAYYGSTATRSLGASTSGNFYLITEPITTTPNTNYTVDVECRKSGGSNYQTENSEIIVHELFDEINGVPVKSKFVNGSGLSITTTESIIAATNFTTGALNTTNNISWVFDGRASITYANTGTVGLYMNFSNGERSQTYNRYGTAGAVGSIGAAFSMSELQPNTTYQATLMGNVSTGAATMDDMKIHMFELQTERQAINNSIVYEQALTAGTPTLIDTINIRHEAGGNYDVEVKASVNTYNTNSSQIGYFWINNSASTGHEVHRTFPTTTTGETGNTVLFHSFSESGTGTQTYNLYGYCPNAGCVVNGSELMGFVVEGETVTPNQINVFAYDAYNLTQLTGFNVTIDGSTYESLGTSVTVPHDGSGTATITINKTGYFSNTTTNIDTTTDWNASLFTYTEIYAQSAGGSTINNFSITWNGTNYSTTNGVVRLRLFNVTGTTVTIFNANHNGILYQTKNASLNANLYLQNYTFNLFFSNSFLFQFRNETTNLQLQNKTVFIELISDSFAANYSTANGTINITLLTPESYQIIYWYDPDVPREYYVTLTNQSIHNLTLYTIDEDISSFYVAVEKDESNQKCSNNTVSLLRYYIDINGYRTVEMAKTDTNGESVFRVQPNIINYKFSFTGDCGNYVTDPQKLIDTTNSFTVTNAQSPLTSTINFPDILQSLVFVNATGTFTFTWNDPTSIVTDGCLEVDHIKNGVTSLYYNTCAAGTTGSLIYTVNDTNNTVYNARGILNTNTEFSRSIITTQASYSTALANLGLTGVFITILVVIALIMFGSQTAATTIVSAVGGLALMAYMGFFLNLQGTIPISITLLAVYGGILLYKMRT